MLSRGIWTHHSYVWPRLRVWLYNLDSWDSVLLGLIGRINNIKQIPLCNQKPSFYIDTDHHYVRPIKYVHGYAVLSVVLAISPVFVLNLYIIIRSVVLLMHRPSKSSKYWATQNKTKQTCRVNISLCVLQWTPKHSTSGGLHGWMFESNRKFNEDQNLLSLSVCDIYQIVYRLYNVNYHF